MGKGGEDDRETLTKWRDEDNKESVTQSEQWPQRGGRGSVGSKRGDTSERWTSSRLLPDGSGSRPSLRFCPFSECVCGV